MTTYSLLAYSILLQCVVYNHNTLDEVSDFKSSLESDHIHGISVGI